MKCFKLCITFLNGTFHGVGDAGQEEWPPSPMRVYQALVATAGRIHGSAFPAKVTKSLQWLSELPPPEIDAPPHRRAMPIRSSVPNNAMDICARAWSRGSYNAKDAKPSTHKAMKTIAPVRLVVDEPLDAPVTYRWSVADCEETTDHSNVISSLARQLVCVGWGLDLVAGYASLVDDEATHLETNAKSVRWTPQQGNTRLRLPNAYTLQALQNRHQRFASRLAGGTLASVPALPPSAYGSIAFGQPWETQAISIAAFNLIEVDGNRFVRFPATKGTELVGMVRSAIAAAAKNAGWNEKRIAAIVLGHGEARGEEHQSVGLDRFSYIPLPSLERRSKDGPADHVGFIRRLLIFCPSGKLKDELDWARRSLAGALLVDEQSKESVAMLSSISEIDPMVKRYTGLGSRFRASTWSTVTPMILPRNYMRHQDSQKLKAASSAAAKRVLYELRESRIDKIIRLAFLQAGYSEVLAQNAEIDWRKVGYWPGSAKSDRFFVPDHLRRFPCLHVRITWRDDTGHPIALPGPIVIGGGRFFGLGLFAADPGVPVDE